jgi:dTDP-4-dehydrorhamnose 3,5-epimerase
VPAIRESARIRGVRLVALPSFADERGRLVETFRREWFPEIPWDAVQGNRSDSRQGVLRGLHYHFRQADYWVPFSGTIRVGLYDLRRDSPTRGAGEVLDLRPEDATGVLIPAGVAHGYLAVTEAVLTYVVNRYYDPGDEFGVAWNDPEIGLAWGISAPVLSPRDVKNPPLAAIPADTLPR